MLKRAILRKDPTFAEGDYGFRAWGEVTGRWSATWFRAPGATRPDSSARQDAA